MELHEKPPAAVETATAPAAHTPDGKLTDDQLKAVAGGASDAEMLSKIAQATHDMNKAVISNIRA